MEFYIMTCENVSVYFIVTHIHERSKYLPQILPCELSLQYSIKKAKYSTKVSYRQKLDIWEVNVVLVV